MSSWALGAVPAGVRGNAGMLFHLKVQLVMGLRPFWCQQADHPLPPTEGPLKTLLGYQLQVLETEPSQHRGPWRWLDSSLRLPGEHRAPESRPVILASVCCGGGGWGDDIHDSSCTCENLWFRPVLAPHPTKQCPHDPSRVIFDVGLGPGESLWLPRGHKASADASHSLPWPPASLAVTLLASLP